jgi:diadenylate cyclase
MSWITDYLSGTVFPTTFHITYIIEILLYAFLIYALFRWLKDTRAYTLIRGIIVIVIFVAVANLLRLTTVTWAIYKISGVLLTILAIIFQPELRRSLEQLGRRNILFSFFKLDNSGSKTEDQRSIERINNEIVKAVFEMSKTRTGALIVIEKQVVMSEFERTGIPMDALISSQLLMNIFVKNSPLHDGAVFIRDQRIVASTCYLPLSDNMTLSKELGTRHRAGVGISEVSDSTTIIVSEETGDVSVAKGGKLDRNVDMDSLTQLLNAETAIALKTSGFDILKGMIKSDKQNKKDSDN